MKKPFWTFQNKSDGEAELLLYGDIADSTWYGDEVTAREFEQQLRQLGDVEHITVRINSGGGDVFAAQSIGNLLQAHPATVKAQIDGLCASAATIVACHCDTVAAAEDSTYMIHPVRMGLCGYFDREEMDQYRQALDAITESIVTLYARKTGQEKETVAQWMAETNWYTAQQAREHGFVDTVTQGGEPVKVENRSGMLAVNSVDTRLPFASAPEFVQTRQRPEGGRRLVNTPGKDPGKQQGGKPMDNITTTQELKAKFPELVSQLTEAAATAERERIRDILEMALPGTEEMTADACFTAVMSADEYARAAMKQAKQQGAAYLDAAGKDAGALAGIRQQTPTNDREDHFLDEIRNLGRIAPNN